MVRFAFKQVRRILILVGGGAVLLAGIAMIVLPGPAVVVIPIGLAILGTEFPWARRLLRRMKAAGAAAIERVRRRVAKDDGAPDEQP